MRVGTYNVGDGNTYLSTRHFIQEHDITAVQEMLAHDQWPSRIKRDTGYLCEKGNGREGQKATQVYWNPNTIRLKVSFALLLLPRQYLGEGAGPDHNSPKWMIGGLFEYMPNYRDFYFFSVHNIPTQGTPIRSRAALEWSDNLVHYLKQFKAIGLVAGDFNTSVDGASTKPLRDAGFVSNHHVLAEIDTHDGKDRDNRFDRPIDHIWIPGGNNEKRISFVDQEVMHGQSDHGCLSVKVRLKKGRKG